MSYNDDFSLQGTLGVVAPPPACALPSPLCAAQVAAQAAAQVAAQEAAQVAAQVAAQAEAQAAAHALSLFVTSDM